MRRWSIQPGDGWKRAPAPYEVQAESVVEAAMTVLCGHGGEPVAWLWTEREEVRAVVGAGSIRAHQVGGRTIPVPTAPGAKLLFVVRPAP